MSKILNALKKQLTSFEDACKIENLDAEKIKQGLQVGFEFFPENDKEAMRQLSELVLIIKAANRIANGGEEWIPDYDDGKPKWAIWAIMAGVGGSLGLRLNVYGDWHSHSSVGSRLCFYSEEVARFIWENFSEHYRAFFVKTPK